MTAYTTAICCRPLSASLTTGKRQARRIAEVEAAVADLTGRLGIAQARLKSAPAETERLAGMVCKHPAAAVSGGTCQACGAEVQ